MIWKHKNKVDKFIITLVEEVIKEEATEPQVIVDLRDVLENGYKFIKDPKTGKKMKVDSYTASAIIQIYDKLDDNTKAKYAGLGLLKMQDIAFR